MFTNKKTKLFDNEPKVKKATAKKAATTESPFVQAGLKKGAETLSGNGALKYSTTGKPFVDQFSSLSVWKAPREMAAIWADQAILWALNSVLSVAFILFMRTITRVVMFWDGSRTENPQRGSGLKHEAISRMLWLAINHNDTFWKNIHLYLAVGSWKDFFKMMELDLVYHGWDDKKLNFEEFADFVIFGLAESNQSELIKKYLPSIDARSKCTTVEHQARTMIGKYLASRMGISYAEYRR